MFGKKKQTSAPTPVMTSEDAEFEARMEALEAAIDALAATLRTIPELSDTARKALCDILYDGGRVSAYEAGYTRKWMLDITMPGATHNRVWSARAFNSYVAGEHSTDAANLCQCADCQAMRQMHATWRHEDHAAAQALYDAAEADRLAAERMAEGAATARALFDAIHKGVA